MMALESHAKLAPKPLVFISSEGEDLRLEAIQGGTSIKVEFGTGGSMVLAEPDRMKRALKLLDIIERPTLYARNSREVPSPRITKIPPSATELRRDREEREAQESANRRRKAFEALFGTGRS